jgi:glycosyltransferase involved in cell wall biosynthesis
MKHYPLFSIITVCWNSDKTISRTIESVLGQDFQDYEYLIVDGGSTDRTIDIIKTYEPQFNGKLKYRSEPDKGIYDAFNKGIERATGKYIWLVNSDDFIQPGALGKLHNLVKDNQEGDEPVISAIMNCISENEEILYQVKSSPAKVAAAYRNNTMGTIHPATIVPKRIYDIVGLYDINYKIIGDIDWFKRAYQANMPIIFADFVVTNFMVGGVSTASGSAKSRKDRKYLLRKFYPNIFAFYYQYMKWLAAFYITKYIRR